MDNLKSLKISVDRRQVNDEFTDLRVWINGELKTHGGGINYLSFLLCGGEWIELFNQGGTFEDGYHLLQTFGEDWKFIDLDQYPREDSGVMSIRYTRVKMPKDVRAEITRDILQAIVAYDSSEPQGKYHKCKSSVVLDYTGRLEEWSTGYGQGTGTLDVQAETEVRDALGSLTGEDTFDRCWKTISNIALNTTHKASDKGIVRISAWGFD
jgi:hypothetical protein